MRRAPAIRHQHPNPKEFRLHAQLSKPIPVRFRRGAFPKGHLSFTPELWLHPVPQEVQAVAGRTEPFFCHVRHGDH